MIKLNYVVIDFEGFIHENEPYLMKKSSVFGSSYQDTLILKPVSLINFLLAEMTTWRLVFSIRRLKACLRTLGVDKVCGRCLE